MKSTVEQINPVQYRVQIEVSSEEVNQAFDNVFRRLQQKARIQGFRPGKAPLGMIRRLYSGQAAGEVHESLISTHLFGTLDAKTIRPIASPVIEKTDTPQFDKTFAFTAVVDILPTLDFDDYKGVEVEAQKYAVTDETVTREIDLLRRRHAHSRPAAEGAAAAKGMLATIAHKASLEGQPLPQMTVADMAVNLGAGEIFAGLEEQILGMKVGETKTAPVALPADYGETELAGKTLTFEITLKDLKELDLPAFDDEFAKDLEVESADALKASIKEQLEARATDLSRQKLESAVLDKILASHPFEVPPAMVDQVIDSMISEFGFQSEEQRQAALRSRELRERCLATARRRTQNTLILWHVTQKEKIGVQEAEVAARVDEALATMTNLDPKQRARIRGNLEARVRESLIFEKAMDLVLTNAKVTEVPAQL